VQAPADTAPADVRALSGKWRGTWINARGQVEHTLIVERINGSTATVVYATGEPTGNLNFPPAWRRVQVIVGPGTLDYQFPNGATINYKLQSDGTLAGTYTSQGFRTTAKLTRQPG
jgi:hypothetical protein